MTGEMTDGYLKGGIHEEEEDKGEEEGEKPKFWKRR